MRYASLIYLFLSTLYWAISWWIYFKVLDLIRAKCLGTKDFSDEAFARHLRSMHFSPTSLILRNTVIPILAAMISVLSLFLIPLLFRGYIADWKAFSKMWYIGILTGFALLRLFKRKLIPWLK